MNDSAPPPSDPLLGTVLGDRYLVQELVAEGGMGRVYLGQHTMMRKRIALKVIHPHLVSVPEVVARFEREAIAAGHIEHANAVAATDFGRTADGALYLVMEYVEGRRLDECIQRDGRFPVARVVHVTKQIVRALRRAHSLGIVHRDVKPENVLLIDRDGDHDFVKVLDFGIAKMTLTEGDGAPLTQIGMVYGTPEYMSPEQATGSHVDLRADLYSVGVLMYEMLAGRRPFQGASPVELLGQHVTATVPPFSEVASDLHVPAALESLVQRLMAKLPEQRPSSADEVLEALDAVGAPRGPGAATGAASGAADAQQQHDIGHAATAAVSQLPASGGLVWSQVAKTFAAVSARELRRASQTLAGNARRSPRGAAAIVAGAVVLVGATVLLVSASTDDPSTTAPTPAPEVPAPSSAGEHPRSSVGAARVPPQPVAPAPPGPARTDGAAAEVAIGASRAAGGDYGSALAHYREALRTDSRAGDDPRLRRDVVAALGDRRAQDEARLLVQEVLRERIAAELADAAASGRPLLRRNAKALLEEVLPAERWPRFLVDVRDLRAANGCGAKKAVVVRMRAAADPRVLPALLELRADHNGCGFLGMSDCNACLRPELSATIQELQQRDTAAP